MDNTKSLKFNLFFLGLFLLAGGLLSILLKYEVSWDFANYHFYNPWAFLNNRVHYDIGVGGINTYFNPLMDVPLYLMIKYFNDYPNFIFFMQGLWAGALMFCFFKLCLLYFNTQTLKGVLGIFFAISIALTGSAMFLQIGTSTNEIMVSFFVMLGLYLLIQEIFFEKKQRYWIFFVAGLLLGTAMGLKLTSFIYCVGSGLALLIFYKELRSPYRLIALFALGGLIGFLIFNGFWMWKMWVLFQNPLFPLDNTIFKSDYLPVQSMRDKNFLPARWFEYILWPVIISLTVVRAEGINAFVVDFRPLIVYVILIAFILKYVIKFIQRKNINISGAFLFLIVFELISFILWEIIFSIVRYYIVIEMIGAIFIVKAIWGYDFKKPISLILYYSIAIFVLYILLSTPYFSEIWGKHDVNEKDFQGKFFYVEDVNIPDDTLLLIYDYPSSAAIPFFAERVKNLRAVSLKQDYLEQVTPDGKRVDMFELGPWGKLRREIILKHNGPKILLRAFGHDAHVDFNNDFIFEHMTCRFLKNNILPRKWMLCVPPKMEDIVWPKKTKNEAIAK